MTRGTSRVVEGAAGATRIEIAASILDADLGSLREEIVRVAAAGADRIHLDVMDAHFVPNLTFGPRTIRAVRDATSLPFDAHLMTSQPGRFLDDYLDAGCDSITIHVEIAEALQPTLDAIRAAGRQAGLAVKPGTPLSALDAFRGDLDLVLIMTVEPGFGGQAFMPQAADKSAGARGYLRPGGRVHVDGGIRAESAGTAGALGADTLVVGSALWRSADMRHEIGRIRAIAEAGRSGIRPTFPA